ncbi:hypothetical protein Z043_113532 [Scleropages formosus]|uniref:Uncharacterized protein n=1 Tax=Scleropages formosus TaxID=113540 RepID=A0A0N8JYY5_SCLFO|nr:hypothetical protein Z043_113532 [Scleropages formosus]
MVRRLSPGLSLCSSRPPPPFPKCLSSAPVPVKMSGEAVLIPDDRAFSSFRSECCTMEGWNLTYNKNGITVWIQILEEEKSLHKIKPLGHGALRSATVAELVLHLAVRCTESAV